MNVAIVGIGGIGGYVGAHLAQYYASHEENSITFIQRGIHGITIAQQGLTFIAKQTIVAKPHKVCASPQEGDIYDVIFFCVKSKDLEASVHACIPHMHNNTVCISLLNGVNNAQRLQQLLPYHRVLDGCIYVSAAITAPGEVTQKGGAGTIYMGSLNKLSAPIDEYIVEFLQQASIKAIYTNDIITEVWKKYLFICPFATMTSRYNMPIGVLIRVPELHEQTKLLMQEVVQLAQAHTALLSSNDIDAAIELAFKIPENTPTSMQLDVYSGKVPELDVFTAYVVKQSQTMGIATPMHSQILPELTEIIAKQVSHG